ncbi:MAG: hypothetical protein VKP62_03595 [Candidatus Sericytochromatia bacterium]|nr:hypothetical protein [Candidatus Sericytochromatia bacterium]
MRKNDHRRDHAPSTHRLTLGLMIGLSAWLASAGEGQAAPSPPSVAPLVPSVTRWEYKVVDYNRVVVFGDSDQDLRLLGLLGWELVSVTYEPQARTTLCFFKRPLPAEARSPRAGGRPEEGLNGRP